MVCTFSYASALGPLVLAADDDGLTGAWFTGQKYFGRGLSADAPVRQTPVILQAQRWLDIYFSGREPDFSVLLHPGGTPFQMAVWGLLAEIPYGETRTYGALAQAFARRQGLPHMSAQAVGGAVGRNPISIFIPCHRCLGADGSLTGYAGGLGRKRALLELESAAPGTWRSPHR